MVATMPVLMRVLKDRGLGYGTPKIRYAKGDTLMVDDKFVRALTACGVAEKVDAQKEEEPTTVQAPAPVQPAEDQTPKFEPKAPEEVPSFVKPKRKYQRRDMKAKDE